MNVRDLVQAMEDLAPTSFAAPWDNVGLLVGDPGSPIAGVLLAIDCTSAVLDEARRDGIGAIVSYHPPIFDGQKHFVAGSIAFEAARAGVAIYSPHTAFDVAIGGTNDVLADALGMTQRAPLRAIAPGDAAQSGGLGFGRIGAVPLAPAGDLVERVKAALGASQVLVAGGLDRPVSRAAVCAGSGGDLLVDAIAAGADLLLTGELRHHQALAALAAGMGVVCTLHSVSERAALGALERKLRARLSGIAVRRSQADRDPFSFA